MSAASPSTWMPTYWGSYTKKTGHFGALLHGAYLMLIKHYWCTASPLPDDDSELWRIATCDSIQQWRKVVRPKLAPLFKIRDGLWYHHKVEEELAKAKAFIAKQAANGKSGGRPPKKPKTKPEETQLETQAKPTANPNQNPTENPNKTTTPTPTTSPSSSLRSEEIAVVAGARAIDAVRSVWPDLDSRLELPGLSGSLGMVTTWIADGADLERDILPTIVRLCRGRQAQGPPRSFKYFAQAIADAKATNEQGLPDGRPSSAKPAFRNGWAEMAAARFPRSDGIGANRQSAVDVPTPHPDHSEDA